VLATLQVCTLCARDSLCSWSTARSEQEGEVGGIESQARCPAPWACHCVTVCACHCAGGNGWGGRHSVGPGRGSDGSLHVGDIAASLRPCITVSLCHCVCVSLYTVRCTGGMRRGGRHSAGPGQGSGGSLHMSDITASLRPCITVSLCHCVTVSLCHCVTVSLCRRQWMGWTT